MQILIVAVVVAFCFGYAIWTLAPASAKKWIALRLLERSLPRFLAEALGPYASSAGGCACDGCDRSAKARPPGGPTPITVHPRRQR